MRNTKTQRKNATTFFLPLLCGLLLFACEGGKLDTEAVSRKVEVNAIKESTQTRVTNGMWEPGDAIGLFMKPSGSTLSASSVLSNNVAYITASGNTGFLPANEAERILFPFNVSDVNFIGYYPFTTEISDFNFPVNVSDQSDLATITLLYSNNATGLNARSPFANLVFSHQLSKIVVNIRPENPNTSLMGISVRLTNTGTTALFSLADGKLGAPITYGDISFNVSADGRLAQAIVLPTTDLSAKHLAIEIGDTQYVFAFSNALNITSFNAATRYTFNITLNPQGVNVITEGSITDWIDGEEEDITLDPCEDGVPDLTKGSRKNPFTIEEARANSGRTNVWVEGYIVGFYASTSRASFVNNNLGVGDALASNSNLALAFDVNESVATNTFPIMLGSGSIRNRLSLQQNPENFRRKVVIRGTIGTYLSTIGLRDLSDFEFLDD